MLRVAGRQRGKGRQSKNPFNLPATTKPEKEELDALIKEQVALTLDALLFLVFSSVAITAKIIFILYIISATFTE